jgi:hypothetical protein
LILGKFGQGSMILLLVVDIQIILNKHQDAATWLPRFSFKIYLVSSEQIFDILSCPS